MHKRIYILFAVLGLAYGIQAQEKSTETVKEQTPAVQTDMVSAFINMPDSLTPYLAKSMREDMADYFKAGSDKRVSNTLEGESYMLSADSGMVRACIAADKSFITLKRLLTAKGDTLYALIETVSVPARDSRISFYNTGWQLIKNNKLFTPPTVKDFFKETSSAGAKEALKQINISFTELSITNNGCMEASFAEGIREYLPEEVCKAVTPYLKSEPLYYMWDGKSFRKTAAAECNKNSAKTE